MELSKLKKEFITLLKSTNREGIDDVLTELEKLGFFEAPASTRFHLNCKGGLLQHSVNVCNTGLSIREAMIGMDESLRDLLPKESVIIAGLLHDVCKADIYKSVKKKEKNNFGVWVEVPGYDVDYSNFPLGHGEKSVIVLLQCGLELTDEEIMAIRWHMHAWDLPFQSADIKGNLLKAKELYPLVSLIQAADGLSSNLLLHRRSSYQLSWSIHLLTLVQL